MVLQVSTEQLRSRASEAEQRIAKMKQDFEGVTRLIEQTSGCWIGEAGDHYRSAFADEKPQLEEILNRLREFPSDLLDMAGVYERTEKETEDIANDLPIDLIL